MKPRLEHPLLVDVEFLHFYELRAADLSSLSAMHRLRHLKIHWNTKLTSLDALGGLKQLETLVLLDTPKASDLEPLRQLSELSAFLFGGGIWHANEALSLAPLASLPKLAEVALENLRIHSNGLRPLAGCAALETLTLSNQFETEEYAWLSVALPHVQCSQLAPWVPINPIAGKDTMIIGKRKPMLDSRADGARIAKYEEAFRKLQARFRADLGRS